MRQTALQPKRSEALLPVRTLGDIEYFVKGRAEVTRGDCEFYYGAGDTRCAAYPAP